jgi:hypothetical protein
MWLHIYPPVGEWRPLERIAGLAGMDALSVRDLPEITVCQGAGFMAVVAS